MVFEWLNCWLINLKILDYFADTQNFAHQIDESGRGEGGGSLSGKK